MTKLIKDIPEATVFLLASKLTQFYVYIIENSLEVQDAGDSAIDAITKTTLSTSISDREKDLFLRAAKGYIQYLFSEVYANLDTVCIMFKNDYDPNEHLFRILQAANLTKLNFPTKMGMAFDIKMEENSIYLSSTTGYDASYERGLIEIL